MWIARDKDGSLSAYEKKPTRFDSYFGVVTDSGTWDSELWLDEKEYPEVTWESSPKELVVKEDGV